MFENGRKQTIQRLPVTFEHGNSISCCMSCMSKRCQSRDKKVLRYTNMAEHWGLTHVPPKHPSGMFRDRSVSVKTDRMCAGLDSGHLTQRSPEREALMPSGTMISCNAKTPWTSGNTLQTAAKPLRPIWKITDTMAFKEYWGHQNLDERNVGKTVSNRWAGCLR